MTRLTFHLILHTHWDREWYLPRAAFAARLGPVVGDVLDMLDRDSEARFVLDGQTIVAEDALDIHPEWNLRVASAVHDQRLEVGPWYILADELVPSGESLIRNLLNGRRDAEALGGPMDVLYSPDAFGHPAILPALAAEFGIECGVVWRGLGRPTGRDRDLYRWIGPDGAGLLIYHLPAQGYEVGYELAANARGHWSAIRRQLVDRAVTSHIAVFVGADHHAPARDPAGIRDAIHALESGNFVRISSLGEFFAAAGPEAAGAPSIAGELRSAGHTWALQGTHGTRARLKRRHGAAELYLQRQVEPLAALAAWHLGADQHDLLRMAWRMLLQCQFHDTICGCCSDLVAREQETRLTSVVAMAHEIGRTAMHALTQHDPDRARVGPAAANPTLLCWNPVPRVRTGVITAALSCFRRDVLVGPLSGRVPRVGAGYRPFSLVAPDGTPIPVQVLSVRPGCERIDAMTHYPDQDEVDVVLIAFEGPDIPSLGAIALTVGPGLAIAPERQVAVSSRLMENRFVSVIVERDRVELIDRRSGERYVDILGFIDERDDGDTYTPSIRADVRASDAAATSPASVLAAGPLVGAIERHLTIASAGHGTIGTRMVLMLHADSPVLRVRLEVDNRATGHRLRLRFPIGAGDVSTAGSAFGSEERARAAGTAAGYPVETPSVTAPAHRYVAAGAGNRGLAVLSPTFFEYEWAPHHELIATLIRSVGELSLNNLPTRPGHAGWPMPTPEAEEAGSHVIELAVAPLGENESTDAFALEQLWEDVFLVPQQVFVRDFVGNASMLGTVGVTLDGAGLVCSAIKPAESGAGMILRCYNVEPAAVKGSWTFRSPVARAYSVRADETVVAPLEIFGGNAVHFVAPAHGIVTVMVTAPSPVHATPH